MKQTTLVLVFNKNSQILLNMKKRGFGVGKYNGAGGKVENGETIIAGAKRELEEETGIILEEKDLKYRGLFHFRFENKSDWDQDVSLFTNYDYTGEVFETEEMKPTWFNLDEIPYDKMWDDDHFWLPRIIAGEEFIEYQFLFDENGKVKDYSLIK